MSDSVVYSSVDQIEPQPPPLPPPQQPMQSHMEHTYPPYMLQSASLPSHSMTMSHLENPWTMEWQYSWPGQQDVAPSTQWNAIPHNLYDSNRRPSLPIHLSRDDDLYADYWGSFDASAPMQDIASSQDAGFAQPAFSHLTTPMNAPSERPEILIEDETEGAFDDEQASAPPKAEPLSSPSRAPSASPGESNKIQCQQCGKAFGKPWNLRAHMLTHEQERPHPHVCQWEGCLSKFVRKPDLIRHEQSVSLVPA